MPITGDYSIVPTRSCQGSPKLVATLTLTRYLRTGRERSVNSLSYSSYRTGWESAEANCSQPSRRASPQFKSCPSRTWGPRWVAEQPSLEWNSELNFDRRTSFTNSAASIFLVNDLCSWIPFDRSEVFSPLLKRLRSQPRPFSNFANNAQRFCRPI